MSSNEETGLTSWRTLLEESVSKSMEIRGANFLQLSTVENGEPRCRTIVMRGFLDLPVDHPMAGVSGDDPKSCLIRMCTHGNSPKVAQNKEQQLAEIAWWFGHTNEQYRLRGDLVMVGNDTDDKVLTGARQEMWESLRGVTMETFFNDQIPGEPYQERDETKIPKNGRDSEGNLLPPPDHFQLMFLKPTRVDYLRLAETQYRQIDTLGSSGWTSKRVNP